MIASILNRIDRGLVEGALLVVLPDGTRRQLGTGTVQAQVALHRMRALWRLVWGGSVGWYEAWARREWSSPDPVALFALFSRNRRTLATRSSGPVRLAKRLGHWRRRNHRRGSRRNIAAHYDLGNSFYRPWLDAGMNYSSALFTPPGLTLEQAQQAKLDAILARTATRPGDTILEIGCGWGGFAATAARAGVKLHGITLSTEQQHYVEALGLDGVTVSLTDYRDVSGIYDAVASIEMVEAVGERYWPAYLDAIARALKPGGRAALQLIAIDDAIFADYAVNVDFIQRYIFPGGLLLSETRFRALAEARGLAWQDRTGFGLDYAETLQQWRHRFDAAAAEGRIPASFDRRFRDLWRYYLMYCEGGFRGGGIDVAQVTLVKQG